MDIKIEEKTTDNEEKPLRLPVPDGHERLATQSECNDINRRIERSDPTVAVSFTHFDSTVLSKNGRRHSTLSGFQNSALEARAPDEQAPERGEQVMGDPRSVIGSGDHVNRFLLCALVGESAKRIKARAGKMGETLPMTMIVRSVLRSYRLAAKDKEGPLARPEPSIADLHSLNAKILKDELTRHSRDRVRNSRIRLAHAERLRDEGRILAEKERLERAIELHDRLADELR
ncbi:MAG TPA: hypothetical protein VIG62_21540 [Blastocatellia bacterium]|jgi:hypothetical protein